MFHKIDIRIGHEDLGCKCERKFEVRPELAEWNFEIIYDSGTCEVYTTVLCQIKSVVPDYSIVLFFSFKSVET